MGGSGFLEPGAVIAQAENVLNSIPTETIKLIKNDKELGLSYRMLKEELAMRRTKDGRAFAEPSFKQAVFASNDPNLINRFIKDQIEAQTIAAAGSRNFKPLIDLLTAYLSSQDQDIKRLHLELGLQLADALLWDQQYKPALDQYESVYNEAAPASRQKAWARFGQAEVRRYGSADLRDFNEAENNYEEAIAIAAALPESVKAVLLVRAKLGLAKLKEMQKDRRAAWDNLPEKALIKAAGDDLEPAILNEYDQTYAKLAPYEASSYNVKAGIFHGADGRGETQVSPELEIKLARKLHLTLKEQNDFGPGPATYSWYAGLKAFQGPLTMEAQARVPKMTVGNGEDELYFRHPDVKLGFFYWDDNITGGASAQFGYYSLAKFDLADPLNTFYASLMYNLAGATKSDLWRGLRVGAEFNRYSFAYLGQFQARNAINLGGRYEHDLGGWGKAKLNAGWLAYTVEKGTGDRQWTDWNISPRNFEAGIELDFNIGRNFNISAAYNRQQTTDYPIDVFTLGFGGTR